MNCKNCKTELLELDDYCKSCGGRVIRKRLTFKNLFSHLSETFFNYDNKLLRTFICLFKIPEDVIAGYIDGVRKKYINPISFFGLALTLSGLSIFILKKFYIDYIDFSGFYDGLNVPEDFMSNTTSNSLEYNSLIYAFLIPLFALLSWIVFINRKYNFTEHVIIYLYSISLWTIILVFLVQFVLFFIPDEYFFFSLLSWPMMFLYHCYILKRIFKLSFGQLLLKALFFIALFLMSYFALSIVSVLIMFATGVLDLNDFAPK